MATAVKQFVELFQRYVAGDLDVFMLHKKLYSLEKRVELDEEDPLVVSMIEDIASEVDSLALELNNTETHDTGELRYQIAAMLPELLASIGED